MADNGAKISALDAAETLAATDVLAGVNDGETKKFTLAKILAWVKSQLTKSDVGLGNVANVLQYSAQNKPSPADLGAQPAITASGVLIGDGSGGITAKTLDTAALTDDNDHVPTSGIVKSALDVIGTVYTGTIAEDKTVGSANVNIATIQLPAGVYVLVGGLQFTASFTQQYQISIQDSGGNLVGTTVRNLGMAGGGSVSSAIVAPSSTTTYYLRINQSSGSDKTATGIVFKAVKLA